MTSWAGGNQVVMGSQMAADATSLEVGQMQYFALSIHMDDKATIDYQGGEITFDLTVIATQDTGEGDAFGDNYDADAAFPVTTADQLVEALTNGKNVTLKSNIALTKAIEIPKDKKATLDLAGYTIRAAYTQNTGAIAVITNRGTLTIKDSGSQGAIILEDAVEDPKNGYSTNVITNLGKLTVDGGQIINMIREDSASFAIDTGSGAVTTINGGYMEANNFTVLRVYTTGSGASSLTINGGLVRGVRPVWVQHMAGKIADSPIYLNITGGTLTSTDTRYGSAIYSSAVTSANRQFVQLNLSGCTLNGAIALRGGQRTDELMEKLQISNVTILKVVDSYPAIYYYANDGQVVEYTAH